MEHFIFSLYIINFIVLTNFGVSICCTTFEQSFYALYHPAVFEQDSRYGR